VRVKVRAALGGKHCFRFVQGMDRITAIEGRSTFAKQMQTSQIGLCSGFQSIRGPTPALADVSAMPHVWIRNSMLVDCHLWAKFILFFIPMLAGSHPVSQTRDIHRALI
jgi:hypothetical protein